MSGKIISAKQAVELVRTGDTLAIGGFVGFGIPEELLESLRQRFLETAMPRDLTLYHCAAVGDGKDRGANRLGCEGLLKTLICAHIGLEPALNRLTVDNKIATYMIPQGVTSHLLRAIAGKKVGVLTHVGLKTFVDPRLEGCKANDAAKQAGDVVKLLSIDGRDQLLFPSFPINVCFIRGTYADEDGNISMQREAVVSDQLEMAAATHNSGGIVIAQVDQILERNSLKPHDVKIHGSMVDYVVQGSREFSHQSYLSDDYHPEWSGECRVPLTGLAPIPLTERKVIARRGALELRPGMLVNLGIGIPDAVAAVAAEEGVADRITLSIESGVLGGVPLSGVGIGGSVNAAAIYKMPDIFDVYDGGGIDLSCLGAAQIDPAGSVNVSKFAGRVVGPGGFINISQNAKKVCFCGSFVAGKQRLEIRDGRLSILEDGTGIKFVPALEQVTFSGDYARETGQEVLYITERAVFKVTDRGLTLTEVAPGVDLNRDVLGKMGFAPAIADDLRDMDARLFRDEPMGLAF
ncbi:MAG: 3-oxoacid CoA-transferase [Telmatospirillum sp.]|nr:3-oxoacid CoA-transferase [Telmatospirillum sp.]